MAYNDGWRVYEDIPVNIEKANMLRGLKLQLEVQLKKQIKVVDKFSEKARVLTLDNSTRKRRSAANLKLQTEYECRDNIQRRIGIIEEWLKEFDKEREF